MESQARTVIRFNYSPGEIQVDHWFPGAQNILADITKTQACCSRLAMVGLSLRKKSLGRAMRSGQSSPVQSSPVQSRKPKHSTPPHAQPRRLHSGSIPSESPFPNRSMSVGCWTCGTGRAAYWLPSFLWWREQRPEQCCRLWML